MNRHQDELNIYMANPLSTLCKLVIKDKIDKYIRESSMSSIKITDNHILFPSERSGYTHLYLYNLNGQLKRTVTAGSYEVKDVYGYDEATGNVYYAANQNGAAEQQIYVAKANGKTECISAKGGTNSAIFSSNFKYYINIWSDMNTPSIYTLNDNNGKQCVFEKHHTARLCPLKGQDRQNGIPDLHYSSPPFPMRRWKVS